MNKVIGKKLPVLAVLTLCLVALNGCSSASTDENAGDQAPEAAPPVAQNAPTDAVPDDHNPEIELAIAAGAVIVDPAKDAPPQAATDPTAGAPVGDPTQVGSTDPNMPPLGGDVTPAPTDHSTKTAAKSKKKKGKGHRSIASVGGGTEGGGMAADGHTYTVKHGDTLMKIAYDQYGDLYKWKEIYANNKSVIADPNHVPPGTKIQLANGRSPASAVEHTGDQYLIKTGDTLGKISTNVYGTNQKWKQLWENNKQLIRDPNKIYAGFYLYYVPEGKKVSENETQPTTGDDSSNSGA